MSSHHSSRLNKRQLLAATIASLAIHSAHAGDILWDLEEPAEGGNYSGISNVRGWAVSSAGIDRAELYIDGTYKGTIPTGGLRGDIATAYASYPDADKAGFSAIRNYSLLDPATSHTLMVKVIDNDGDSKEITRTINTARFGDSVYIDDSGKVSLDGATISGSGSTISITGMSVDGAKYDIDLNWDRGAQGMGFSAIAAASTSGGGDSGGDSCVNVPFPSNGTQVTWESTVTNNGATVISEVNTTYTSISTTQANSSTSATTSTQGATTTTQTDTEQHYSIVDGYLYSSRIGTNDTTTTSVQGYNTSIDVSTLITFSPDRLVGPAGQFCVNQSWTSQPVTRTATANGVTTTGQTEQESGSVESVNETISVGAGAFTTVKVTTQDGYGSYTEWTDINSGVLVKATGTTDEGQVTWELTALN